VAQQDDYAYPHYLMGKLYLSERIFDKAEEELTKARQYDPSDLYTLTALADVCIRRDKTRDARRLLDEILERHPGDRYGELLLATLHLGDGRKDDARKMLKKLVKSSAADEFGLRARDLLQGL
jgi:predicted Zn-dependent protease